MAASKLVLECPFCDKILEVKPPDKLHSAYSSIKPIINSYHSNVVQKKYKCKNPECKKPITIYWYAPLDYFNRI
jgi:hypothetical protein